MNRPHTQSWILAFVLLFLFLSKNAFAEDLRSTLQIEKSKKSWDLFAETKTRFQIEGRIRSRTDANINMRGSTLSYRVLSGVRFPTVLTPPRVVVLKGYFDHEQDKAVFRVESVTKGTTRYQRFLDQKARLNEAKPAGWKELAEETESYAHFYDDEELLAASRSAWLNLMKAEKRQADTITSDMMEAWIKRLKEHSIAPERVQEWTHEMLWMEWDRLGEKASGAELLQLAGRAAELLANARTPLDVPQPMLSDAYFKRPERFYEDADAAQRKKLERLFYVRILLREILLSADPEGKNGAEIAKRIRDSIPERPDLARKYDTLALDYRFENLETAGRDEALALAAEFRQRGDAERSKQTFERWLRFRLELWKRDGADGFVRAAGEYVELLEDRDRAFELLSEAWKLDRDNEAIVKEFRDLGYRLHEGRWITSKEFAKIPPDKLEEAAKSGKVLQGMSPEQVLRAIGKPTMVRHSFFAGHAARVWIYGESEKKLTIHFVGTQASVFEASRVVAIGATN